jgi:hypothetical protein
MRFQKSQPAGAATLVPHSASTGPLKNMDASSPARKGFVESLFFISPRTGHGSSQVFEMLPATS